MDAASVPAPREVPTLDGDDIAGAGSTLVRATSAKEPSDSHLDLIADPNASEGWSDD